MYYYLKEQERKNEHKLNLLQASSPRTNKFLSSPASLG